jgi:hypothetical protein
LAKSKKGSAHIARTVKIRVKVMVAKGSPDSFIFVKNPDIPVRLLNLTY